MKTLVTIIALTACVTPLAAQWAQYRTPGIPRTADGKLNLTAPAPRTADGKPDLTGLWDMFGDTAVGSVAVRKVGDLKPADVQPVVRTGQQRSWGQEQGVASGPHLLLLAILTAAFLFRVMAQLLQA